MRNFFLRPLLTVLLAIGLITNLTAQDLIITGVMDGPLTGGKPKVLELYAVNDIADLSVYKLKNQTNANTEWGSSSFEFEGSVSAGDFLYVVYGTPEFNAFFENTLTPLESSVLNVNGDDRLGLFNGETLVDIFGADGVDGTNQPWEYLDGWAYRNANATPSATFNAADWTFSGINVLDGATTNATATPSFPIGTYTHAQQTTCELPTSVTSADVEATTATISWTAPTTAPANGYEYVCSETNATPTVDGTTTNETSVSLTGLTAGTTYYVFVRSVCATDNKSDWTAVYEFTTTSNNNSVISDYPYVEDFEIAPLTGWTLYQSEADDPGFVQTSSLKHSGTSSFYHSDVNVAVASDSWLVSPAFACTGEDLSLWYLQKYTGSYYNYSGVWISTASNDPITNPGDFVELQEFNADFGYSDNVWSEYTKNLSDYSGQTIYIAIKYTGDYEHRLYIDDFKISTPPTCPKPTALTAETVAATEAVLSWTAGETETAWKVIYGEAGFDPASAGTTVDVTENPFTLTGLSGETAYDVYVKADCGGDLSEVSNVVSFTTLPTCPKPTALTVTNITATGADLSWTAGGTETDWKVIYGAKDFDPAGTEGTVVDVTVNPTFTFTGLTAVTEYDVYVKADCGAGDMSSLSTKVSFTTLCAVVTPDYTQNFDAFLPDCWAKARGEIGATLLNTSAWGQGTFANASGITAPKAAKINLYGNSKRDWLVTPDFDLSAGGYELKYDIAVTKYNNTDAISMGSDDEVQVLYSEDNGTTWNNLKTYNVSNTPSNTGVSEIISLASVTGNNVKFAFWASEGTVDDIEDYDVTITNFVIHTAPSCPQPTGLAVNNMTATEVELSWTAGGTEAAWKVIYGEAGFDPAATGTTVDATTNPFTLTGLTAETAYDVYVKADCGGELSALSSVVSFTTLPTCPAPTAVTLDAVSTNEATLSWTAGGSETTWTVIYGEAGFDVATEGSTKDVTAATVVLDALSPATTYNVYVKATCSVTDESDLTPMFAFTTGCDIVTNLPFTEDFEGSAAIPTCWTVLDEDNNSVTWYLSTVSGSNKARHSYTTGMQDGWLIMPQIALPADGEYQLKFTESGGYANDMHKHSILVSTTGKEVADFTEIWVATAFQNDDADQEVDLSAYAGQNVYIAFRYEGNNADAWMLDDIVVESTSSTCELPTDVTSSNVEETTATISWTAPATVPGVGYEYVCSTTSTAPTEDGTATEEVSVDLTDLTVGTTYYVFVRSVCTTDDKSAWTSVYEFTTQTAAPTAVTLPFEEDFENGVGDFILENGTQTNYWVHGALASQTGSCIYVTNNGTANEYTVSSTSMTHAYVPVNFDGVRDVKLSFDWLCKGEYSYGTLYDYLKVYLVPSGIDVSAGSLPDDAYQITERLADNDNVVTESVILTSQEITEDNMKLVFSWRNDYSSGSNPPASVDNISLTEITCPAPTALAANNVTATDAELSWTAGGTETAWNVIYGEAGFDPATEGTTENVTTNSFTLTNLTAETAYEVYVKSDCGNNGLSDLSDALSFTTLATCPKPTALTADNATATQVELSWTNGGAEAAWKVIYGEAGFDPATEGTTVDADANPFTLTGLVAATDYEVYVKADCGNDDLSSLSGVASFMTSCVTVTPDYTQEFVTVPPACWSRFKGLLGETLSPASFTTTTSWQADGFANDGTTGAARSNIYGSSTKDWLVSPAFDLSAGNYELKYDVAATDYNNTDPAVLGDDDKLLVLYTENGTDWNILKTYDADNTPSATGTTETIPLTMTGAEVKFAFYTESTVSGNGDNDVHIDNFIVQTVSSTCPKPTALAVSNLTANTADVAWTENGTATTWNIKVSTTSIDPAAADGDIVANESTTNNPYSLSGLTENTTYYVYVQADCGSDWSDEYTFMTQEEGCAVVTTLPFVEGFEGSTLPDCWTSLNMDSDPAEWQVYNNHPHTGQQAAYHGFSDSEPLAAQEGWLITPKIALPANGTYVLNFWEYTYLPVNYDKHSILVSTTGKNTADFTEIWVPVVGADSETNPIDELKERTIDLSAYAGQEIYVAFKYEGDKYSSWFLDDINIGAESTNTFDIVLMGPKDDMASCSYTNAEHIQVKVSNNLGNDPIPAGTTFTFTLESDGTTLLTEEITTTEAIQPSTPLVISTTGTIDLSAVGTTNFTAYISAVGDMVADNDTVTGSFTNFEQMLAFEGETSADTIAITSEDLPYTVMSTVTINPADLGLESTYLWADGSTTPSISVNETGWYVVTVTTEGCETTDSVYVDIYSGINVIDAESVSIYPNPSAGQFKVNMTLAQEQDVIITVINNSGQVVREMKFDNVNTLDQAIDVTGVATGLYNIRINAGGEMINRKLVIK